MSTTPAAVSLHDLRKVYAGGKSYAPKEALKGITLDIPQGSFFGLLGPNGAGKSTLINILAGLVVKTSGSAAICGYDIDAQQRMARMALGVVPQELILDTFFTVRQALEIHAGYYAIPKAQRRTQEIIDAMGLSDKADIHSRKLSGGMRRRLLIAKALVHHPRVLILDEPTAGVDVELRNHLWEYVRELNRQGTTVVLTTHYLEEAEALCDQIAIIDHGSIIAHDTTKALLATVDSKILRITVKDALPDPLPEALTRHAWQVSDTPRRVLSLRYRPSQTSINDLLDAIQSAGCHIADISIVEAGLEEVFLHLTSSQKAA